MNDDVKAAREEQREACAEAIYRANPVAGACVEVCRATPIAATPLADEITALRAQVEKARETNAALRARVAELEAEQESRDDVMTAEQRLKFWADNPHACPVHFGARTACGQCFDSVSQQLANHRVEHAATLKDLRSAEAEVAALKAQVEAAREGLDRIASWDEGPDVCGSFDEPGSAQTARDALLAMDLAANGGKATLVTTMPGFSATVKMPKD